MCIVFTLCIAQILSLAITGGFIRLCIVYFCVCISQVVFLRCVFQRFSVCQILETPPLVLPGKHMSSIERIKD